jgi:DNA-binding NarL/FixJ family response regulator
VGSVVGGRDAVAQAETLQPDVVLVDLQMPLQSGVTLLPHLRARLPDAILVALTLLDPDTYQAATLAAGADAFVSKMRLEHDLIPTIRRLAAGRPRRADVWQRPAG